VASLVIILRLFRLVKIVEELSVGASERMEDMEGKMEELERENSDLKTQIEQMREEYWRNRDSNSRS
jgi:voltage-gated hydrogen channel 1